MGRVEGKVALITGAASGLGAADAERLAEEGAIVVLADINASLGREVASTIPNALFLQHDVRDEAQWQEVVGQTVRRYSRLDILVNNAGFVRFASVEECSLDEFRLHLAVMTEGTFLGCKYGIPAIAKSGGGAIINMASTAGIRGMGAIPAYSAAKGAIIALTRSVAVHCQDKGYEIRVNVLVPGAHDTPMTPQLLTDEPETAADLAQTEAIAPGKAKDVADLALFLASDEARQITGASIVIDNGATMK